LGFSLELFSNDALLRLMMLWDRTIAWREASTLVIKPFNGLPQQQEVLRLVFKDGARHVND
jgi:hypothetical protein